MFTPLSLFVSLSTPKSILYIRFITFIMIYKAANSLVRGTSAPF